jgi:hypothetical protein
MPLSQSRSLVIVANVFGTIFVAGGFNCIFLPERGLSFFELNAAAAVSDQSLVDAMMLIYGAGDIFIGLAAYSAAYFGDRKSLGCIMIAASAVAFADGLACRLYVGKGEWNHWGYTPLVTGAGVMLLGVFD